MASFDYHYQNAKRIFFLQIFILTRLSENSSAECLGLVVIRVTVSHNYIADTYKEAGKGI
jgi:hypothetical protein